PAGTPGVVDSCSWPDNSIATMGSCGQRVASVCSNGTGIGVATTATSGGIQSGPIAVLAARNSTAQSRSNKMASVSSSAGESENAATTDLVTPLDPRSRLMA